MAIHLTGNNSCYYLKEIISEIFINLVYYRIDYYIFILFVFIILHLSGQSEIGHFDNPALGQKDIAGR